MCKILIFVGGYMWPYFFWSAGCWGGMGWDHADYDLGFGLEYGGLSDAFVSAVDVAEGDFAGCAGCGGEAASGGKLLELGNRMSLIEFNFEWNLSNLEIRET